MRLTIPSKSEYRIVSDTVFLQLSNSMCRIAKIYEVRNNGDKLLCKNGQEISGTRQKATVC